MVLACKSTQSDCLTVGQMLEWPECSEHNRDLGKSLRPFLFGHLKECCVLPRRSTMDAGRWAIIAALLCFCILPVRAAEQPVPGRATLENSIQKSAPAKAAEPAPPTGIVRVINQLDKFVALGSGTLITRESQSGVLMTCAHLFDDGVGDLYAAAPSGQVRRARLLAVDRANDLACLLVHDPPWSAVTLATGAPGVGEQMTSGGFGQEGKWRLNRGRVLGFGRLNGAAGDDVVEIGGVARQGDSGGPMLNAQGQLAAVIMGTDGRTVDGTHAGRIQKFLADHPAGEKELAQLKREAARPVAHVALALRPRGSEPELVSTDWPAESSVQGRVMLGKRPLAGAKVKLHSADTTYAGLENANRQSVGYRGDALRTSEVDEQGRFKFSELKPGQYWLEVEGVALNKIRRARQEVSLTPPRHILDVTISVD